MIWDMDTVNAHYGRPLSNALGQAPVFFLKDSAAGKWKVFHWNDDKRKRFKGKALMVCADIFCLIEWLNNRSYSPRV